MPAPPDGDRVFELVESTHRYLLTREQDARDLFQTLRSEDRRERIVPSLLFWAAILGASVLYVVLWISRRAPS
jgi:lipid-A-disaccharide synthase-like uncharacterized protein